MTSSDFTLHPYRINGIDASVHLVEISLLQCVVKLQKLSTKAHQELQGRAGRLTIAGPQAVDALLNIGLEDFRLHASAHVAQLQEVHQ